MARNKAEKTRLSSVEEALYGKEPKPLQGTSEEKVSSYLREAMHYYTYAVSAGQKKKWFLDYLNNEEESSIVSNVDDSFFALAGALARIWSLGTHIDKHQERLIEFRKDLLSQGTQIENEKKEKKQLADSAKEKAKLLETRSILSKVDIIIDDIISGDIKIKDIDAVSFFKENRVSEEIQKIVKEKFKSLYEEVSSSDEYHVESYAHLGRRKKKLLNFLSSIVNEQLVKVKSPRTGVIRKPRKKKAIDPAKAVARLQYCNTIKIGETVIKSIDPKKMIGSNEVWIYNNKYRSLTKLVASTGGFHVKGTTIQNLDEKESITKKIRKPDQIIPEVSSGGKVYLRRLMESLTTKESKTSGRMNKEVIILRVF